ncbi:zinc ribbon domain-containing protein [Anabaenopsis elenkinii]|uniref:zinc ribbon domain-containing protein n=1 Tax=Anabaenopsis elenkinii TaxID=156213 RepID=UPI001CEE073C|nr:zinc ribbon domain-containing protein [Anabaenopsis elenkinii]
MLAAFIVVISSGADAPRPTFASQCKSLTVARQENEYLKRVNAQSLQQTLRRLEKAFVSMWEQNHGFPRFKKKGRMRSFSFSQYCGVETGKKELSERTHVCSNCGYTTDRDVASAQVVAIRGLAVVGHTVKMLREGKFIGIPVKQESPGF